MIFTILTRSARTFFVFLLLCTLVLPPLPASAFEPEGTTVPDPVQEAADYNNSSPSPSPSGPTTRPNNNPNNTTAPTPAPATGGTPAPVTGGSPAPVTGGGPDDDGGPSDNGGPSGGGGGDNGGGDNGGGGGSGVLPQETRLQAIGSAVVNVFQKGLGETIADLGVKIGGAIAEQVKQSETYQDIMAKIGRGDATDDTVATDFNAYKGGTVTSDEVFDTLVDVNPGGANNTGPATVPAADTAPATGKDVTLSGNPNVFENSLVTADREAQQSPDTAYDYYEGEFGGTPTVNDLPGSANDSAAQNTGTGLTVDDVPGAMPNAGANSLPGTAPGVAPSGVAQAGDLVPDPITETTLDPIPGTETIEPNNEPVFDRINPKSDYTLAKEEAIPDPSKDTTTTVYEGEDGTVIRHEVRRNIFNTDTYYEVIKRDAVTGEVERTLTTVEDVFNQSVGNSMDRTIKSIAANLGSIDNVKAAIVPGTSVVATDVSKTENAYRDFSVARVTGVDNEGRVTISRVDPATNEVVPGSETTGMGEGTFFKVGDQTFEVGKVDPMSGQVTLVSDGESATLGIDDQFDDISYIPPAERVVDPNEIDYGNVISIAPGYSEKLPIDVTTPEEKAEREREWRASLDKTFADPVTEEDTQLLADDVMKELGLTDPTVLERVVDGAVSVVDGARNLLGIGPSTRPVIKRAEKVADLVEERDALMAEIAKEPAVTAKRAELEADLAATEQKIEDLGGASVAAVVNPDVARTETAVDRETRMEAARESYRQTFAKLEASTAAAETTLEKVQPNDSVRVTRIGGELYVVERKPDGTDVRTKITGAGQKVTLSDGTEFEVKGVSPAVNNNFQIDVVLSDDPNGETQVIGQAPAIVDVTKKEITTVVPFNAWTETRVDANGREFRVDPLTWTLPTVIPGVTINRDRTFAPKPGAEGYRDMSGNEFPVVAPTMLVIHETHSPTVESAQNTVEFDKNIGYLGIVENDTFYPTYEESCDSEGNCSTVLSNHIDAATLRNGGPDGDGNWSTVGLACQGAECSEEDKETLIKVAIAIARENPQMFDENGFRTGGHADLTTDRGDGADAEGREVAREVKAAVDADKAAHPELYSQVAPGQSSTVTEITTSVTTADVGPIAGVPTFAEADPSWAKEGWLQEDTTYKPMEDTVGAKYATAKVEAEDAANSLMAVMEKTGVDPRKYSNADEAKDDGVDALVAFQALDRVRKANATTQALFESLEDVDVVPAYDDNGSQIGVKYTPESVEKAHENGGTFADQTLVYAREARLLGNAILDGNVPSGAVPEDVEYKTTSRPPERQFKLMNEKGEYDDYTFSELAQIAAAMANAKHPELDPIILVNPSNEERDSCSRRHAGPGTVCGDGRGLSTAADVDLLDKTGGIPSSNPLHESFKQAWVRLTGGNAQSGQDGGGDHGTLYMGQDFNNDGDGDRIHIDAATTAEAPGHLWAHTPYAEDADYSTQREEVETSTELKYDTSTGRYTYDENVLYIKRKDGNSVIPSEVLEAAAEIDIDSIIASQAAYESSNGRSNANFGIAAAGAGTGPTAATVDPLVRTKDTPVVGAGGRDDFNTNLDRILADRGITVPGNANTSAAAGTKRAFLSAGSNPKFPADDSVANDVLDAGRVLLGNPNADVETLVVGLPTDQTIDGQDFGARKAEVEAAIAQLEKEFPGRVEVADIEYPSGSYHPTDAEYARIRKEYGIDAAYGDSIANGVLSSNMTVSGARPAAIKQQLEATFGEAVAGTGATVPTEQFGPRVDLRPEMVMSETRGGLPLFSEQSAPLLPGAEENLETFTKAQAALSAAESRVAATGNNVTPEQKEALKIAEDELMNAGQRILGEYTNVRNLTRNNPIYNDPAPTSINYGSILREFDANKDGIAADQALRTSIAHSIAVIDSTSPKTTAPADPKPQKDLEFEEQLWAELNEDGKIDDEDVNRLKALAESGYTLISLRDENLALNVREDGSALALTPDYVSIAGRRLAISQQGAKEVVEAFGMSMPTPGIVDEIISIADGRDNMIRGKSTAGPILTSNIEESYAGGTNAACVGSDCPVREGLMKTNVLLDDGRLAIYGGYTTGEAADAVLQEALSQRTGEPFHDPNYGDYSHGMRAVKELTAEETAALLEAREIGTTETSVTTPPDTTNLLADAQAFADSIVTPYQQQSYTYSETAPTALPPFASLGAVTQKIESDVTEASRINAKVNEEIQAETARLIRGEVTYGEDSEAMVALDQRKTYSAKVDEAIASIASDPYNPYASVYAPEVAEFADVADELAVLYARGDDAVRKSIDETGITSQNGGYVNWTKAVEIARSAGEVPADAKLSTEGGSGVVVVETEGGMFPALEGVTEADIAELKAVILKECSSANTNLDCETGVAASYIVRTKLNKGDTDITGDRSRKAGPTLTETLQTPGASETFDKGTIVEGRRIVASNATTYGNTDLELLDQKLRQMIAGEMPITEVGSYVDGDCNGNKCLVRGDFLGKRSSTRDDAVTVDANESFPTTFDGKWADEPNYVLTAGGKGERTLFFDFSNFEPVDVRDEIAARLETGAFLPAEAAPATTETKPATSPSPSKPATSPRTPARTTTAGASRPVLTGVSSGGSRRTSGGSGSYTSSGGGSKPSISIPNINTQPLDPGGKIPTYSTTTATSTKKSDKYKTANDSYKPVTAEVTQSYDEEEQEVTYVREDLEKALDESDVDVFNDDVLNMRYLSEMPTVMQNSDRTVNYSNGVIAPPTVSEGGNETYVYIYEVNNADTNETETVIAPLLSEDTIVDLEQSGPTFDALAHALADPDVAEQLVDDTDYNDGIPVISDLLETIGLKNEPEPFTLDDVRSITYTHTPNNAFDGTLKYEIELNDDRVVKAKLPEVTTLENAETGLAQKGYQGDALALMSMAEPKEAEPGVAGMIFNFGKGDRTVLYENELTPKSPYVILEGAYYDGVVAVPEDVRQLKALPQEEEQGFWRRFIDFFRQLTA